MANKKNTSEEPFSDDPRKNLQLENEILRLKLQAEFDAVSGVSPDIPAELENEFLKNVLAFEQQYARAQRIKVRELLGSPVFKRSDELDDQSVSYALQQMQELMAEKNIDITFIRPRDDRFKFRFITEELFDHEMEDMNIPGMTYCFTYEEFHPDHEMDIRDRAIHFLTAWFNRSIDNMNTYLADDFIDPAGNTVPKDKLLAKLDKAFAAYTAFENPHYHLADVVFELKHDHERIEAMGYAEGELKYMAVLENGEQKHIEGPFKIFFNCEYGWWNIFFFYLPGLNA